MDQEKFLKIELTRLNAHLPKSRISLKEALGSESPGVLTRSGRVHSFDRRELEELAKLVEESEMDRLMLPIFIEVNPRLGRGTARISGRLECKVVGKILQREAGEEMFIYRPEVAELRRRLPTTTCYVFVGGGT